MSDSLRSVARQAPLSLGFPGRESWSGLPFISAGDLPNPGIEHASPELTGRFFTTKPPGKPQVTWPHFSPKREDKFVVTVRTAGRQPTVSEEQYPWYYNNRHIKEFFLVNLPPPEYKHESNVFTLFPLVSPTLRTYLASSKHSINICSMINTLLSSYSCLKLLEDTFKVPPSLYILWFLDSVLDLLNIH